MKVFSLARLLVVLTLLISATSAFAEAEYQSTVGDCSGADTSNIEGCLFGDTLSSPTGPTIQYCTATNNQGCWTLTDILVNNQITGHKCDLVKEAGTCTCSWDGQGWVQQGKCNYF